MPSRTRSVRPGFPGFASRAGSLEPSRLDPGERSACHSPNGGDVTLRTSGSVSIHEHARVQGGWPKPYPPGATPSLTSESSPPPRLSWRWFGSLSRQIAFSARFGVGASPSAIGWCARPAPATYSIHFSKTTAHASSDSEPRCPHWARGLPLSTSGGPLRRIPRGVRRLFDFEHTGGPCLCPSVAGLVLVPVAGSTHSVGLDHSRLAPRRRHQKVLVRKGLPPVRRRPFTGPVPALAFPGG